MAPLTLVSLFFLFYLSSSTHLHPYQTNSSPKSYDIIREACNATRFPTTCETVLIQSGNISINPKPIDIIKTTISISTHNLKTAQDMVKTILDDDLNRTLVVETCLKVLRFSEYRFSLVARVLPRHELKDARAYLSAALLYQVDCWSGLTKVNGTKQANEMVNFVQTLTQLTSNALSMVVSYDRFGNKTSLWKPPMTERDGYWELANGIQGGDSGLKCGFPVNLAANVTVCKEDGVGCYRKIQEAVNRAPDNDEGGGRFVILIKEGVYKEIVRIPLHKRNIVFVGEGIGKTVITGSVNVRPGVSTYNTATVGVLGDGFMARDLTFENTAGPDAHQAVAYRSDSDQSIIENCEFLGHQDTLYARALRQLYISCRIEGNVDFIFGNSAAVFHNSTILIRPRQISPENGETNVVAAHGRTDPAQSTGFVFRNCTITGTEEYMKLYHENPKVHKNYLGRPWKEFSRTVFINSYLADLINPDGWMPWEGDFALSTLYYGELENYGQGANLSARVSWSNKIPEQFVDTYSIQNFIQADDWVSSSLY